jgi:hypothetical protein
MRASPQKSARRQNASLRERPFARSSTAPTVRAPFSFGEGSVNDIYAEALAGLLPHTITILVTELRAGASPGNRDGAPALHRTCSGLWGRTKRLSCSARMW